MQLNSDQTRIAEFLRDNEDKVVGRWADLTAAGIGHRLSAAELRRELDRRAGAAGAKLTSVAAHPGYAATHLQAAAPEKTGNRLAASFMELGNRLIAQSDAMGALPQLYAATMPDVEGGEFFGPDAMFESRGYPRRVAASTKARDLDAAQRLWSLSEELTGVHYDFAAIS